MVLAARAATLWELGRRWLPETLEIFDLFRETLRAVNGRRVHPELETVVLHDLYDHLRPADFSADFLARAVDSTLVFPLEDLLWSDWGRPKRVIHSIQALGLQQPARFACTF
jgi:hypothetical protein